MAHHAAASNLIFLPVRRYISTTASRNAASASAHSEAVRSACTAEHAAEFIRRTCEQVLFEHGSDMDTVTVVKRIAGKQEAEEGECSG